MAKAQTLQTNIVINARTGNGFSEVGNTLTELGSLVNGFSQQLIGFGEDSIKVYREYEKSMKDAEVALSTTYGRNSRELQNVMNRLDASATDWAATTIFHTNDVANAISEAAHAGWDYEQIMSGIPAAMRLAQAGGLDLSESVNYIVKSVNAAGVEFENLEDFIDLWTFSSNSSASNIQEFGDAMLRMGSTMRFTGNIEELMTLLAVTADAGSVGSEAGTLIRNSIIRLIAPTEKADEAMAELGATAEETIDLLDDSKLAAANARLEAQGFSAFDEKGNLKDVLDIYRELYLALGDIAGGYENIEKNEDSLAILSAIFPTRTITEALTLIRGAADNYSDLYDQMVRGDAEGYGKYASEAMMDTLDGRIETFGSKVERLKQLVGGELSGQLSAFLEPAGNLVDWIAELDEGKFSALVSGLEVIAVAGPGLLTVGGALRLIGSLIGPGGAVAVGALGVAALAASLKEISDADFRDGFGLAELDKKAIMDYAEGISAGYENAYQKVNKLKTAVEESITAYTTASQNLSGELLTAMLTSDTLTAEEQESLRGLGEQMHDAVISGLRDSKKESQSYFELLFGGKTSYLDSDFRDMIGVSNSAFDETIAEAESIGEQMRQAMTAAFADGKISDAEYENIQSYIRSYNDAIAQASTEVQAEQDYISQQMILHRAQTASLDELDAITAEVTAERDRVLSEAEETYLSQRYGLEYRYNQSIAAGKSTEAERDAALAAIENKYNAQRITQSSKYDDLLYNIWNSQVMQSDYGTAYDFLGELATGVLSGNQSTDDAIKTMKSKYGANSRSGELDFMGNNTRTQLGNVLGRMITALGGYEDIASKISMYDANGDSASATRLRMLYSMQQINDDYYREGVPYWDDRRYNRSQYYGDVFGYTPGGGGIASHSINVTPVIDSENIPPVQLPVIPNIEGDESVSALENQGVEVQVEGDTTGLVESLELENGQTFVEYIFGDTTALVEAIEEEDGKTILTYVNGDASQLASLINSYNGKTVRVNLTGSRLYAEGGRATTASIFGEAGPEWAIPEQHSQRTADLLDAAREASGFTWGELIARNGGLNANPHNVPTQVVYSPTIYANNASDVEDALIRDKARLDRWWSDKRLREDLEVYR